MRSLVFIALLGLALAVPVPHASLENDIFVAAEMDADCYDSESIYEQGRVEDDLRMDNFSEDMANEDCDDEPIQEEVFADIVIPDEIAPGQSETDVYYSPVETIDEEDCEEEKPDVTEAPPVFTRPPPQDTTIDNSDCVGEEGDFFEELDEDDTPSEIDPLNTFAAENAYVEIDSVFHVEEEGNAGGFEECIEY